MKCHRVRYFIVLMPSLPVLSYPVWPGPSGVSFESKVSFNSRLKKERRVKLNFDSNSLPNLALLLSRLTYLNLRHKYPVDNPHHHLENREHIIGPTDNPPIVSTLYWSQQSKRHISYFGRQFQEHG